MSVSIITRPQVSFFPSHDSNLFSVRHNGKRYELTHWEKAAIVITAIAGALLAGVGVLLGFWLSYHLRNRMIDRLVANPEFMEKIQPALPAVELEPRFNAKHFEGTDKETAAPVGAQELFYQQKQIGYCCGLHSLCNFAGRNIEGLVPTIIKANNESYAYLKDRPNGARDLQMMKDFGYYIQSFQSIVDRGTSLADVLRYMNQNKRKLHLPETCAIQSHTGSIDSSLIQNPLRIIQAAPSLHRVIVSISNNSYAHFSAIRKDAAGQWRVVDSMQKGQPGFSTIQEAVQHVLTRHRAHNRDIHLIYPSQDQQPIPDIRTAGDRSSSSNV